jgi:hypothetical protein
MTSVVEELHRMRQRTSTMLEATLRVAPQRVTEAELRDAWAERLYSAPGLAARGWYAPPPEGIIVISDVAPSYERMSQASFRPPEAWPSAEVHITDDSLLYAYASPVSRETGLIGDFGCSLYRGGDAVLKDHIRNVWEVTRRIIDIARPGMTFPELYAQAMQLIEAAGLENVVHSVHAGSTSDIGHAIPWSDLPPDRFERDVLAGGSLEVMSDLVSRKRRFINATDPFVIRDDVAFTIEPRLCAPGRPMVGFHTVVGFVGGQRRALLEFESLFALFGMDYLMS